jgi:hypothetical protein
MQREIGNDILGYPKNQTRIRNGKKYIQKSSGMSWFWSRKNTDRHNPLRFLAAKILPQAE